MLQGGGDGNTVAGAHPVAQRVAGRQRQIGGRQRVHHRGQGEDLAEVFQQRGVIVLRHVVGDVAEDILALPRERDGIDRKGFVVVAEVVGLLRLEQDIAVHRVQGQVLRHLDLVLGVVFHSAAGLVAPADAGLAVSHAADSRYGRGLAVLVAGDALRRFAVVGIGDRLHTLRRGGGNAGHGKAVFRAVVVRRQRQVDGIGGDIQGAARQLVAGERAEVRVAAGQRQHVAGLFVDLDDANACQHADGDIGIAVGLVQLAPFGDGIGLRGAVGDVGEGQRAPLKERVLREGQVKALRAVDTAVPLPGEVVLIGMAALRQGVFGGAGQRKAPQRQHHAQKHGQYFFRVTHIDRSFLISMDSIQFFL